MLTKTNICSVQNVRGNTEDRSSALENEKQNIDVAPHGKSSADAHEWSCFLAFVFCYFRAFTHHELFASFHFLYFGCKINRINPLVVLISSKLPAITNIIHKLLWALQTISYDN